MEKGHELLAGGTTVLIAEVAANVGHAGGLGMILGAAAGVVAYNLVGDFKRAHAGGESSSPAAPAAQTRKPVAVNKQSLAWKLLNGKSTRIEPEADVLEEEEEEANGYHVGHDPATVLYLGPNFMPDTNMFLEQGIFCCGMKRSGKTSVLALIIEQIGRFETPLCVYDKEGDLQSLLDVLPRGVLVDREHWYSAAQILEHHLQVVVNLQSWDTDDERAAVMCTLVQGLIKITSAQDPEERVPCPQFLDEAQFWLPQDSVDYLSSESLKALSSTFSILLSTGAKRGLTPFCFTQRIAQTRKSIIDLGVQIFMHQALDIDQERAMKYIRKSTIAQSDLAALQKGQGVVCLPDGVQLVVKFDQRRSVHVSKTPTVSRVASGYRAAQKITATPARPSFEATIPTTDPLPAAAPASAPTMSQRERAAIAAWERGERSGRKMGAAIGMDKDAALKLIDDLKTRGILTV